MSRHQEMPALSPTSHHLASGLYPYSLFIRHTCLLKQGRLQTKSIIKTNNAYSYKGSLDHSPAQSHRVSVANVTQQHSVPNCDKPFYPKGFLYRNNLSILFWFMPPSSSRKMNKKLDQTPNQVLPILASTQ